MPYCNSDQNYYCDYRACGKQVDPESRRAVSMPDGDIYCDVECCDNDMADRAAAQADGAHDEARDA